MELLITAVGLVLVFEGLLYALFPGRLRAMMERLRELPDDQLRLLGTASLAAGVFVIWLAQVLLRE